MSSFLCGTAAGLLLRWFYRQRSFFNFTGFSSPRSRDIGPNLFLRFLKNLGRNIRATGPMFLLGAEKIVLGAKRFAVYLGFTILFALLTGWVVNLVV